MKYIYLSFLISFFALGASSQTSIVSDSSRKITTTRDANESKLSASPLPLGKGSGNRLHKVLLIPYNPMMHLSDADNDIAEYSGKDPETLRKMFRAGLTQKVNGKIFEVYDSQSLLTEYAKGNDDLETIYGSIGYAMEDVIPLKKDSVDSKGKIVKTKKPEEKHDLKYMNIKLSHPELLKVLSEKYGTDLFVFINQFEIKTDYNDCINFQLKIYEREIKVHFSIFDSTGKQLAGDVAVSLFPSNTNDPGEIMTGNFPSISSYIAKSLAASK